MPPIFNELEARGLIFQTTNSDAIKKALDGSQPLTIYAGFDPTAPDLHVGHLLGLITLTRLAKAGHRILPLVGGATGFIGDPSGKNSERSFVDKKTIENNSQKIATYLKKFFGNKTEILDNLDWWKKISTLDFLREIGKYFTLGYILDKESVKNRMENGISYTETSYMLLQAYDFWHLFKNHHCTLQVGGADQWGNITSGVDYIRKREQIEVYGLTTPLITTSEGKKFGKSEGNAVWLNGELTHPYNFYQFWFNTPDDQVIDLLKKFTFLDLTEIEKLVQEVKTAPEKRQAQKSLALEMMNLVHGQKITQTAIKISEALFGGHEEELKEFCQPQNSAWLTQSMPNTAIKKESPLLEVLVETGLASSKRQAREDLGAGAIYLNGERVTDPEKILNRTAGFNGSQYTLLRKGKKTYHLLTWIN